MRTLIMLGLSILTALALYAPQSSAAAPAAHGNHIHRGAEPAAEAAIDSVARNLSTVHGFNPASFDVQIYRADSSAVKDIDPIEAGYRPSAMISATSATYTTQGYTSADGNAALVIGQTGNFVVTLQATR